MDRKEEIIVTANTTEEVKAVQKMVTAPMEKHMKAMEVAESVVGNEIETTNKDVEEVLENAGVKVVKPASPNIHDEKNIDKVKNKGGANFDIKLPFAISYQSPLNVFDCNEEMRDYCNQILGDADILVWSLNDASSNRVDIFVKYIVDGNQDAPIHRIKREMVLQSKSYLNFLLGYAGIDKKIVRYVGQVMENAIPLLDKAEKGRKATMSPLDMYKEVVAEISQRAYKIKEHNTNTENEPLDVIYKVIEKRIEDGNMCTYVCTKGKKALKSVLNEVGAECSNKDFLVNMKAMTNYNGCDREFLEVSAHRQFDYTETGGTHWMHLRVYNDILDNIGSDDSIGDEEVA